jgi:ABC-type branched-subunit amino acid transport system substrate-binding protein/predicted negative regulator of RcsB-dependent stress response
MMRIGILGTAQSGVWAGRGFERQLTQCFLAGALLVVLLGLSGCAGLDGFGENAIPREQRAAYDAAMGRLPADSRGAASALEAFVQRYPRSALADDALEQLSQLAFAVGDQDAGLRRLGRILTNYPEGDRAAPARLRLAQLEYARDKRAAARRLLAPLELDRLSLAGQRAALRLKIVLAQTPVERLEHLTTLRSILVTEAGKRVADRTASTRLATRLEVVDRDISDLISRAATGELEEMVRGLRGRPPAGEASLELSRRALDAGQLDLANRRLEVTTELVRSELEHGELRLLLERLERLVEVAQAEAELPPLRELVGRPRPRTDEARGTIGVVLPLSGDFADYGAESLRGILLAADLFAVSDSEAMQAGYPDEAVENALGRPPLRRSEVRIVVRDSQGDPEIAAEAVRELSRDPSLLAVIGPIFSQESLAAADAAEETGVPLVALSTREDLPIDRKNAFRTRTTPSDEVAALVGHAVDVLEAERFAVLYPRTRYGRGMRKLYWEAVVARGGKMVAASSYDPDAVDFATAIRNMIGYRFLTNWERKALDERAVVLKAARRLEPKDAALLRKAAYEILGPELEPLPPLVDFDVLFIPDDAEKVSLSAPGLAFHEINDVGLLGSSDWLDEELLRVARRHVSGAVISTPFYAESDLPFVAEFVDGYRNTFGSEPDAYSAEAFDATNLVLVQLSSGRNDREGVRAGLLDTRAYPGATGVLTMHPNGNARRRPFLLRVSGRRFRPLD